MRHIPCMHIMVHISCTVCVYMCTCMSAHFFLQQQEYDLVLEDQITFVMTETVGGNRNDMVSGILE